VTCCDIPTNCVPSCLGHFDSVPLMMAIRDVSKEWLPCSAREQFH